MDFSRRGFLGGLAASAALAGCRCPFGCGGPQAKSALQLYSIRKYIGGEKDVKTGRVTVPGVGLERALYDVAAIGYKGIEFAGYYGFNGRQLKRMLDANGLVGCGTHIGLATIGPDQIKATCEFNLEFGNTNIIVPGGTNPKGLDWNDPKADEKYAEHLKRIVDTFNAAAETAATFGCKVGLHNHQWEFQLKNRKTGENFWDTFFKNTRENVIMEQDVGWTTCAGFDPCAQYKKYPHRSPTLHAKENGMGKDVVSFDAILGQPGKPGAVGVDWDKLIPVTEADGVEWYVVECEKHENDLSAVKPSYEFLNTKGIY